MKNILVCFISVDSVVTSVLFVIVICEIKLFQDYFSLCRRSSEIILPEIISELFRRFCCS